MNDWSECVSYWVKCEHCGEFTPVRWQPALERERERKCKARETWARKKAENRK